MCGSLAAPPLTIVILTYNRRDRIKMAIAYWAQFPVKLIVLDGSAEPTVTAEETRRYPNLAYSHVPAPVESRMVLGTSRSETPYTMFLSDDEFLVYPALLEACAVLDAETDVSAVAGQTVGFARFKGEMVGRPYYLSALGLDISGDSPIERLNQRVAVRGNSIFYTVTRTPVLALATEFIADHRYSCPYISEYQMEAVTCSAGEVRVLPRVLWLRNFETPATSIQGWDRSLLFHEWCADPGNAAELDRLKRAADSFLARAARGGPPVRGVDFVEKFRAFEYITVTQDRSMRERIAPRVRRLLAYAPAWFVSSVRTARQMLRRSPPGDLRPFPRLLEDIRSAGFQVDADELVRIKSFVEQRHIDNAA